MRPHRIWWYSKTMVKPAPKTATLMLLDTYGLVYRAFFALPPLTTTRGMPINAAYGFTMMLNKLIADEKPTHIVAAFDKGMPVHRVAMYKEYKAQRDQMPDDLRGQFALVRKVLDVHQIPIVEVEGEEADDVIATLALQANALGEQAVVVTGDLDLLQIVTDGTTVLTTRRGITELGRYDTAAVRERFELDPSQLPDYRGLKGDPSDNLPGIPGVGEKTAIKLMKGAGTLDALVANPALAGTPKLQKLIEEHGKNAQIYRDVSIIKNDLDLTLDWESARYTPPANDELYRLYSELEFKTLLNKLDVPTEMPLFVTEKRLEGRYRTYVAATDPPEYAELAREIERLAGADVLAFATRAGGELGLSAEKGTGLAFLAGALDHEPVRGAFMKALRSSKRLVAHDAKEVLGALLARGIAPRRFDDDTMVGAHLLNPSRTFAQINDAASEFLAIGVNDDVAAYADAALQLAEKEREELRSREQLALYEDVEVPLAAILATMEARGITIDPAELEVLASEINGAIARLQREIYDLAGEDFNIGSPQQLGNILFSKLQIPGGKRTKTGWATGVEVLQGLAREYPICARVLEYREVTKLKNTYVDVIPQLMDKYDRRLRTVFNQTATATGRLSSTNPNLQNIPVRGALGRRIRKAFVPPSDDYVLLAADYSQIELRLMAHLSGDEAMRRAFHEGQDIHDFTARQIFMLGPGQRVDPNQRRMAKSVNFGLLYGMSDFGLAQRLEISRAEAKEITTAYFARFPKVRAYIDGVIESGRREGYVTTLLGRRRYMPALRSSNYMLRSAAEREATNAPLQGSAADLMKLAMVRIDKRLSSMPERARMLLQIHDELIFEVNRADLKEVAQIVRDEMEHAIELSVPLEVTVKTGSNWYDVAAYGEEEELEEVVTEDV
ncbi:MAG: DNA polymerase I [Vulcanimicrobiaceae bacterium]